MWEGVVQEGGGREEIYRGEVGGERRVRREGESSVKDGVGERVGCREGEGTRRGWRE